MRDAPTFTTSGNDFLKVYKGGEAVQVNDSTPFDIIKTTSARINVGFDTTEVSGHGGMAQTEGSGAFIQADAEL